MTRLFPIEPASDDHLQQRLAPFVGRWRTQGRQLAGPIGPDADITAIETYEWLAGQHYLIHRFDGHVGEDEAACIEVIGYDSVTGNYPIHTYYNDGHQAQWRARESKGFWAISGGWQIGGKSRPVRCTIAFSEDGATMTGKWEHSPEGSKWQAFWEVVAKREADERPTKPKAKQR